MHDIVIIGSGGLAKEIAFLIEDINHSKDKWNFLGFIVPEPEKLGNYHGKFQIYQTDNWLLNETKNLSVIFGTGSPQLNAKLYSNFKNNKNLQFPNLIHPNVVADWDRVQLGNGNIFCAGNILTTDIKIGSFNLFNLNGTIGHDTIIGDFNVFNPTTNISGFVNIGDTTLIGTGAQVLQNIGICNDVIIGAGAVVTKNIEEPGVYVGMPAKKLK